MILGNRGATDFDWDTETGDLISTPALPMRIKSRVSNVLFLPGIEASRLYRPDYNGGTDRLWEPNIDSDVKDLYLKSDGTSVRSDVYAKEKGIIDELSDGKNIYKSFIAKMDGLRADGTINDWGPIAYDWRLSLDDILTNGNDMDGRLYYSGDLAATSTAYIIQELKRLAATSRTGKVTIVAHSNGGLVAKRLTELLGLDASTLIDKMIFVAVPHAGTPEAIAADLHGHEQDHVLGFATSKSTARTFASTSPMAYNLLPSARYFTQVDNPVITFDSSLPDWIARYGATIHSQETLHTFLTDTYGRVDSQTGDINQPIQLNGMLLSNAEAMHASFDNWTPPAGVSLIQIAGWGVPKTIAGITYKKKDAGVSSDPDFTVDGDGTVVVPSALWTSMATGVANYWMNLRGYNSDRPVSSGFGYATFDHSRILETDPVLNFISDQIASTTKPLSDYGYLSTQAPAASDLRLRYSLHSPLTLNLYDDQGRHTGVSTTTGQVEEQIPDTYYTEIGDVKYIFSGASTPAHIVLGGYASGTFTFDANQYTGDTLTASATFKDIPTATTTIVTMNVTSDLTTLSPMAIDEDGNGIIDVTLIPKIDSVVTPDTTPPELQITFSTTTQTLAFMGTDDSGTTTMTTSTVSPAPKKGKQGLSMATTTITARDMSDNTITLVYTEPYPSPASSDAITLQSLAYNSATTTLAATLSYTWKIHRNGIYQSFVSSLQTAMATLESQYKPRNDTAIITTSTTTSTLPGMVVPYMMTKQGTVIINY
ncbi:hypothetical protein A3A36_02935 [Candidatus Kaiserbacteria bacterium RIFCSPLOWO2_01_FULL_52_12b]|uniref:Uncharacterized protein n=1 Tax=Candidatus Kaiserbacteria bacterium RIFCSPLOWO2_01_FULL_52_12b TaxID=1798509 RepID=A0A1F6EXD4_9BACT|nr:MAG: hypothetical protein A3A36_02935 [Candidatus Kaiserbacteria bacterium RIFCSPLOWO2_01_FULL_52_12b]